MWRRWSLPANMAGAAPLVFEATRSKRQSHWAFDDVTLAEEADDGHRRTPCAWRPKSFAARRGVRRGTAVEQVWMGQASCTALVAGPVCCFSVGPACSTVARPIP